MDEDALIATYIKQDPHRPGLDRARLSESGVHVWALIADLRADLGPAADQVLFAGQYMGELGPLARLAEDYDVALDAILAALAYYKRHHDLIDARIAVNSSPAA